MTSPALQVRRCVVYVRISVSSEESVSVARQIEAAEQYAAARGWQIVGVFRDEGVSATQSKPQDRAGWRELLASRTQFDAVVIWKVDRLARRVLDFLTADEALQERGAGIVAVEQSIDMTTPEGRAFAQMLAVFAEMEASAISARVAAARRHLVRAGRVVGGKLPYGWRSIENPDGPGRVIAQDPETIGYVRGIVDRILAGQTLYSTVQWLNEVGAPTPAGRSERWAYSTVERILRHPVLAGMTPFNPGNDGRRRGAEVLRDATGLPVVDESIAVMPVARWRQMLAGLDEREHGRSLPRALRAKTSGLLSGLVWCGEHDRTVRMHRGTTQGRPSYSCPVCHHTLSNFEEVVIEEFLARKGDQVRWRVVEEVQEGGAAVLPEIEARLDELEELIRAAPDRERRRELQQQQANLLDLRDEKREETPVISYRQESSDRTFREDWAAAASVEERRSVLDDALASITVRRGGRGRRTKAQLLARMEMNWRGDVGSPPEPDETWLIDPPA